MKQMSIESSFLRNEFLFELANAQSMGLSKELLEFLRDTEFPWKALGKELTRFIEAAIMRIAPADRIQGEVSPQATLSRRESIVIGAGAIVEPGAFIEGPTFIEPKAQIRHGAYVRGSVYVAKEAVVGHTTECKGAILLPKAKAAHFNYVGDSILGFDSNLGAGTKLANLKFNHSNIIFRIDGKKIDSGLKKCGAILGNRAQTGCNSVTNPGTILFPDASLMPNATGLGYLDKIFG